MNPFLKKYSFILLVFSSILAGVIWRIEVEHHGWEGLTWLGYYHLAIPVALLLFLIWANASVRLKLTRRIGLNLIALFLALIVVIALEQGFRRMFISGPAAFFYFMGDDPLKQLALAPYFVVGLLPLLIALASRIVGVVCKPIFVILSTVIMAISPEICIFLIDLFDDKGSPNYIHTIKSGYLMGFWFFAIGVVFIRHSIKKSATDETMNLNLIDSDIV